MYMNEYQHVAQETAVYRDAFYPKASLMIEAAELCDLFVKPELRGDDKKVPRELVISEAGDVLWNLANLLSDQGIQLSEVAEYNIKKLRDRKDRGVLMGDGGNR